MLKHGSKSLCGMDNLVWDKENDAWYPYYLYPLTKDQEQEKNVCRKCIKIITK